MDTSTISTTRKKPPPMKGRRKIKIPLSLAAFFFASVVGVCFMQLPNLRYVSGYIKANGDLDFAAPLVEAKQIQIEAATTHTNHTQKIISDSTFMFNSTTTTISSTSFEIQIQTNQQEQEREREQQSQLVKSTSANNNNNNISVRDYIKNSVKGQFFKRNLAILSWDSSGVLDTNLLHQQCRFRNFVEAATFPYLLQIGNAKASQYNPHGVVALLATTDHDEYWDIDWDAPSPIPIIAYSVPIQAFYNFSWVYVVPTPYELSTNQGGGAAYKVHFARRYSIHMPFQERIPIVMYRGVNYRRAPQRERVFQLGQNTSNAHWLNATENHGLRLQDMVPYRYLLDIGGISGTTWIAIWKMCSGGLVFRAYSGKMDWWHVYLEPWKHYVPIREDMQDLKEKWEWAKAHPEESYRIAQAGEQICLSTLKGTRLREELKKVLGSLPPATAELRAELDSIIQDSSDRLAKNETALLFSPGEQPNPQKDYECPH
jgi:hypothetical protein